MFLGLFGKYMNAKSIYKTVGDALNREKATELTVQFEFQIIIRASPRD